MGTYLGTKLASALLILSQVFCSPAIQVNTTYGEIIGSNTMRTRNGRVIFSFTGIPYAKAPIKTLRFKEPEPIAPWKTPFNATNNGPFCVNVNFITQYGTLKNNPPISGQEDCLILNVFSPKVDKAAKLPVILFIHGGGFSQGAGALYGPEYLLDRDVVLVTFNHRLFVFGFLSTGDDILPANVGLKDQALVIRWVHENIANFGGDPNLITLMGESSGSGSCHLNLLSPVNKGLIHRGIAMSGTGFNPWAVTDSAVAKNRTLTLAKLVGCPSESSNDLLKCIQDISVEKLIQMAKTLFEWLVSPVILFGPTMEPNAKNAFLPVDPRQLDSQVPLLLGISSGEGAVVASILFAAGAQYEKDIKERPLDILPKLLLLSEMFPQDKIDTVSKEILKFYCGSKPIDRNTTQGIIDMVTDDWFFAGSVEAVSKYGGNVYFYYYDYSQSVSFTSIFGTGQVKAVCHTDILLNLFPLPVFFPNRTLTKTDVTVSEKIIDIWTGFAKKGSPSENLRWSPTAKTASISKFLHITAGGLQVQENLLQKRVDFWVSLRASNPKTN
ncbi:unnamed protein product [Bemisia tabaci]|uniref:Carboxylic ester hydrolase n=1 Tax=Bemisia tabaci TaxID=7038 RepID=A0A9P0F536_BEMTA|nr:unnamed protein product [Bemisia tabaci]